jgi:hypothetical protein
MKATTKLIKTSFITFSVAMVFCISCEPDHSLMSATDTQNVDSEVASASFVQETSAISTNVLGGITSTQYISGRATAFPISGLAAMDDRLKCATITLTATGTRAAPAGTIIITFDPTCSDKHGVKRSGSIVIDYKGKRWVPGSYWSLTYQNFVRNNVKIEGTDSVVTQISADSLHLQFASTFIGGKITFPDGKSITHTHLITREWFRASTPTNDEWHTLAGGTANGKNKKGYLYSMQITKDLIEKNSCRVNNVFIPVSGTKEIDVTTLNGVIHYVVDYGDGACDNQFTITVNGKAETIGVNNNGN